MRGLPPRWIDQDVPEVIGRLGSAGARYRRLTAFLTAEPDQEWGDPGGYRDRSAASVAWAAPTRRYRTIASRRSRQPCSERVVIGIVTTQCGTARLCDSCVSEASFPVSSESSYC